MMQGQAHVFVHIIYMDRHSRFLMFQDNVATEMEGYIIMLCQGQDMDNLNVKWFVQFLKLYRAAVLRVNFIFVRTYVTENVSA